MSLLETAKISGFLLTILKTAAFTWELPMVKTKLTPCGLKIDQKVIV
jgi:hypothetical protein